MAKHKLGFDSTDANTLAASDYVGSHLYAGGALLTSTGNALDVNIENASIAVTGTVELGATTLAALESITVVATDLDIRDLVFATDKVDVSGSSVELGATTLAALETITVLQGTSPWVIGDGGGSITVDGTLTTTDAAIANTAIENTAATVDDTTAAALLASQLANRKYWYGYNNSNKMLYIGKSGVTLANGMPQAPGVFMDFRLGPALSMFAIGVADGLDYRVMELS